jgi:hypothetical protein
VPTIQVYHRQTKNKMKPLFLLVFLLSGHGQPRWLGPPIRKNSLIPSWLSGEEGGGGFGGFTVGDLVKGSKSVKNL